MMNSVLNTKFVYKDSIHLAWMSCARIGLKKCGKYKKVSNHNAAGYVKE